jgi:hypothetical protein
LFGTYFDYIQKKQNMKTLHLTFVVLLFSLSQVFAQGIFKFEKETHDFGTVDEGGSIDYVFKFTNTGTAPIIIQKVNASCGCTTPEWSKDPVPPGGSGFVKASYNTNGRPGHFNKSITITSNATEANKVLFIKGDVKVDMDKQPMLEPEKAVVSVGKINENEETKVKIKIKNIGKNPLNIHSVSSPSNYVRFNNATQGLGENATGDLEFTLKVPNAGKLSEIVYISTNSQKKSIIEIRVEGEVVKAAVSPVREGNNIPFGK